MTTGWSMGIRAMRCASGANGKGVEHTMSAPKDDARYSVGWSMDERSLYLTDHVEDDHVIVVRFLENWTPKTKLKALRALVDIADQITEAHPDDQFTSDGRAK